MNEFISVKDELPTEEGYYTVKYADGTEDEKPFRIRPHKNIRGFMTEKTVTHWHHGIEDQDFEIDWFKNEKQNDNNTYKAECQRKLVVQWNHRRLRHII